MRPSLSIAVLLVCLLVAGCRREPEAPETPTLTEVSETEERTVAPGDRALVLEGFRGRLVVTGVRDSTASLRFAKTAWAVTEDSARGLLTGLVIDEDTDGRDYVLHVDQDDTLMSVALEARVPYETPLRLEAGDAEVEIKAMAAPVEVKVARGPVTIRGAAADLDVKTDGAIDAELVGFPEGTAVRLSTRNGNVSLQLPKQTSASIRAEALIGGVDLQGVETDSLRESRTDTGLMMESEIGDGKGGRIRLHTGNGVIQVRQQ